MLKLWFKKKLQWYILVQKLCPKGITFSNWPHLCKIKSDTQIFTPPPTPQSYFAYLVLDVRMRCDHYKCWICSSCGRLKRIFIHKQLVFWNKAFDIISGNTHLPPPSIDMFIFREFGTFSAKKYIILPFIMVLQNVLYHC